MSAHVLRVHAIEPFSRANGPGLRAVVWVQGCSLGCPGCFNPQTHSPTGGRLVSVTELVQRLVGLSGEIEGLTVSGGEPLQQADAVVELLTRVRQQTLLSSILWTGLSWAEVQRLPQAARLLSVADVIIAGRYDRTQRLARGLRGSANKTVHYLTDRYTPADMLDQPEAEILIGTAGELWISGIDPPRW